jgi:hypothetical protein
MALSKMLVFIFMLNIMLFWFFPTYFTADAGNEFALNMANSMGMNFTMDSNFTGNTTVDTNITVNGNQSMDMLDTLVGRISLTTPGAAFFNLLQPIFVIVNFIDLIMSFVFAPVVILNAIPSTPLAIKLLIGVPLTILYISAIVGLIAGREV